MISRQVIIGCDPGLDGAFAVTIDGMLVEVEDMPTLTLTVSGHNRRRVYVDGVDGVLRSLICSHVNPLDKIHFVMEEVGPRPKEGPVGAFAFGSGVGEIRGVIVGMRIPRTEIRPATWKRDLRMKKGKDASRQRATELFPMFREEFSRVKDDGRAEASLIAHWAFHHLQEIR